MVDRMKDLGLLVHLREWGLVADGKEGWRRRGRPYHFRPRAIIVHHTASGISSGNMSSERIVTEGRSDLSGPLCHILLGRDGRVRVIATGYTNHAGYGGPRAGVPENQGNTYTIGIEAENNGIGEPWPAAQLNAYYRLCAALLVWIGKPNADLVMGHKEWAPRRKIDPSNINMDKFRENVRKALRAGPSVKTLKLSRVKPGKRNSDILLLKERLAARGFKDSVESSNFFGKGLQNDLRAFQLSIGLKGKDANGVPTKFTLQKLGFKVEA